MAYGRRLVAEPLQQLAEAPAILGEVDRLDGGAEQRHARLDQAVGELERGLAAELDDHALQPTHAALDLDHAEHVLEGERLEVEAVGGVVVGGDRLGVAVDDHRVASGLAHGHGGVHAAVVELDSLADAVGARSENHDRGALARRARVARDLVRGATLPAGVVVGSARGELGGAGVHRLERALARGRARRGPGQRLQLAQEPRVDEGALVDRLDGNAAAQQLEDRLVAVGGGRVEAVEQLLL